ncbi:hypothetical protein F4777DRAFT_529939 [Nemania sp. FL0916]|nr:hypothetical protein F4777DRAFT_529939 [Nemania sp. FL0916]
MDSIELRRSTSSESLRPVSEPDVAVTIPISNLPARDTVVDDTQALSETRCPSPHAKTLQNEAPESQPTITIRCDSSLEDQVHGQPETLNHEALSSLPKRPVYYSLGILNVAIVIIGTVISLAALAFLIFLWAGRGQNPEGQLSSHAWRSIMLSGRLPQLITISALILRVSLSSQAVICTSCVAALVLERRAIPLSQSAPLSVLRSVSSEPRVLIYHIFRRKALAPLFHPEVILLLFVALGNIAVQFSSTILLSDLHEQSVVGFPREIRVNFTTSPDGSGGLQGISYSFKEFPIFGEISSGYRAAPNSLGLSDTDVKRHVMLPFTKDRTDIRSFEGPSIVMSSRVACMPPVISGEIGSYPSPDTPSLYRYVAGRILVEDTFRGAGLAPQPICNSIQCLSEIPFKCGVPSIDIAQGAQPVGGAFCTPIKYIPPVTSNWRLNSSLWTLDSSIYLALSTNLNSEDWDMPNVSAAQTLPQDDIHEEWTSYNFGNGRVINASLCFFAENCMVSNVSMRTDQALTEPSLGHRGDNSDTADVRKLLGASPTAQDLAERGVMIVKSITDPDDHPFGIYDQSQIPPLLYGASILDSSSGLTRPNTTYLGCETCEIDAVVTTREYARVFLDIIRTSGRASVALQSVNTMLVQSLHDQLLEFNNISLPVQVAQTISTAIPVRYTGLIAVMVLTVANIACILAIATLYISRSRYTIVGNYWHAVSQTVSDLTSDTLFRGNQATDAEISDFLKEDERLVRLVRSPETGHVKIVEAEPATRAALGSEKHTSTVQLTWARMKSWRKRSV